MATTIHVGNLSFNLDEEDLNTFFSKYGKVTDTYVVRRNGRPRGYGFVEFDSSVSADNALSADGASLDGRAINIEKAKGKITKSNFGDRDDRDDRDNNRDNRDNRDSRDNNRDSRDRDGRDFRSNRGMQRRDYGSRDYGSRDYGSRDYVSRDYGSQDYGSQRSPQRRRFDGPRRFYGGGGGGGSRFGFGRGGGPGRYGFRRYGRRDFGGPRFGNRGPRRDFGNRDTQVEKEKSATTIYVSNLPFSVDDAQLAKIFNKYKVKTTHIVQSLNGRSRGYGFVEFETEQDQDDAIKEMEGFEVKGSDDRIRNITVKVALVEKPSSIKTDDKNSSNNNNS